MALVSHSPLTFPTVKRNDVEVVVHDAVKI